MRNKCILCNESGVVYIIKEKHCLCGKCHTEVERLKTLYKFYDNRTVIRK